MKLSRHISLLCALLAMAPFASGQQTRLLTGDKSNEYGVVYTLPTTQVVIELQSTVSRRVPGPYALYAQRYLGAPARVKEAGATAHLSSVKMQVQGQPTDRQYLMQMKPGALAQLCLADNGMLLAINTDDVEQPQISATLKPQNSAEPDIDEYLQYVDAEFMTSLSSARKAQLLAQAIMEIRDSRLSLSRGTAETMPTDGRQLELMLQSLGQQEDALLRAFNGYEYTTTQSGRYTFTPDSTTQSGRVLLCRLSDYDGLVPADDYSGEPVYLQVTDIQHAQMPLDLKGLPKAFPKNAVVYALPGTATLQIECGGEPIGEAYTESFAQFGTTFGLDPKLFTDTRKKSAAIFNPATGALERIFDIP